ncbi:sensor histidine kinase [Sporosarcina pasteurii]|uniref:histidine kinase n=1 Tax=Sporosarcina pasteurii TaxID=1474 RepID=A0A380BFR8_SPOPA|nr:sensor histidine kinase [Sporosarcina pasteurii]MDS9470311.1 sensor histidine kinase [Sporosarcina pasteurii]QBQ05975.1 HAMP domain-containing histidine kinase [Sporosarcina pasteurii]SUI99772.1 Sensor histidine kinase graS [Sporosarcina pasteurii]
MKAIQLFLKDHLSFLLFQGFLILFLLLLFWLDGFRGYDIFIYALVMTVLFTFAFLGGKYIMRRSFYAAIVRQPSRMEDALIQHAQGPEHQLVANYTRSLYKIYQDEAQTLYSSQSRQIEFMNHWVHQMKTPISVINLLVQEEEIDRQSVGEELERLQAGLDTVLVNASLETFERDMTIEKINLQQLVQETITAHKRLLITNRIFPVLEIDETLIIASDRKWLKIVIGQFITNAVKYTFEKGKRIYLTGKFTEEGVRMSVRDEGIGIPTSDLNRITNAFFTGENGRLTGESTGMGLYIASEVCEKLGHPLMIESEMGVGTEVTLLFKNGEGGTDVGATRKVDGSHEDL